MSSDPNEDPSRESAIDELAQALRDNPLFGQAVATTLSAGERAIAAQRAAMSALGVSSTDDLERLGRRLRSLSDRLEAIEDTVDELRVELDAVRRRLDTKGDSQPEAES